jgi:hypothetical protein
MEEHFTTYKHNNYHQCYSIMYYQRFKSTLHDFKTKWKHFDKRIFFVHIYVDVKNFIEKFLLKDIFFNPFVLIFTLRLTLAN